MSVRALHATALQYHCTCLICYSFAVAVHVPYMLQPYSTGVRALHATALR